MSASSKKKLRKEQKAAAMNERQQREQKEAKSLFRLTVIFVVVAALILGFFIYWGVSTILNRTGILDRNITALTVNDHKISVAELNYFYLDAVRTLYSNYYAQYQDMASVYMQLGLGLNPASPLDEQTFDPSSGTTWADYFVDNAISEATYYYSIYDHAMANGYELAPEKVDEIEATMGSVDMTAQLQGYSKTQDFLKQSYGFGATYDSYKNYVTILTTVQNYVADHNDSLTYTADDLAAYEADKKHEFNSYSYATYQVSYANYLGEGTKNDDGSTTYSDEQKEAAYAQAKTVAESLANVKSVEELNAAIAKLDIYKEMKAEDIPTATQNTRVLYSDVIESIREWVSDDARKENDVAVLPYTTTDADGKEVTSAYTVVIFNSKVDNVETMGNVRHYLVQFEGAVTDENGLTVYPQEKKDAAKKEAEETLAKWKEGAATEESFIEMVKNGTDDTGSKSTGGLFENINHDSGYVTNFKNWALDPTHVAGDTGIVETEYGYHIMYYVGNSEQTYRDYLIENAVHTADQQAWIDAIIDSASTTVGKTNRLSRDYIMAQY